MMAGRPTNQARAHSDLHIVVTILIVNIDNLLPTAYDTVFKAAGLDKISYAPTSSALPASGWPTLGSMIDGGTRLVTFLDNAADTTSVSYLIDGMHLSSYLIDTPRTYTLRPSQNLAISGKQLSTSRIPRLTAASTGRKETPAPRCI
jgi:hypothetical protein